MNSQPGRPRLEDELEQKRTAQWAALMGLAGMVGFGTLLAGLGVVVYRASSQTRGFEAAVVRTEARVEKFEGGQAALGREVAAVRKSVEGSAAAQEVAALRARVNELSASVSALREQTDRAGTREAQSRQDAAVIDLQDKLVALGARVDRLSAAVAGASAGGAGGGVGGGAERVPGPVAEVNRPAGFSSEEVERELRDMREVINRYREESRMAPAVRLPESTRN